jgi:type IV pilus assembly protein PilO
MLDKMPFWGQVVLMVVIASVVVGLAYWVFPNISETRTEIATQEETWNDKQREIRKGQAIEQRLQEFEREVESLERKLSDVAQILPRDTETGDLLQWIKNLGDQSNLDLKSFSPGGLRPVEFYKEFPIEMHVVGNYHDLGIFLDRVSKYSRIINVDKLQMDAEKSEPDKTIQANFTAVTFVYDENTEGVGAEEDLQ